MPTRLKGKRHVKVTSSSWSICVALGSKRLHPGEGRGGAVLPYTNVVKRLLLGDRNRNDGMHSSLYTIRHPEHD